MILNPDLIASHLREQLKMRTLALFRFALRARQFGLRDALLLRRQTSSCLVPPWQNTRKVDFQFLGKIMFGRPPVVRKKTESYCQFDISVRMHTGENQQPE